MKENSEGYLNDQVEIIRLIPSGTTLFNALHYIIQSIEKYDAAMHASIMLYDSEKNKLYPMVSPSIPIRFYKELGPVEVGPYEGSCGTAAFFKTPIFVSNIKTDPHWKKHRTVAKEFGFQASHSMPILSSNNQLLGTFAIYYKEIKESDARLRKKQDFYTSLAAIAIELLNKNQSPSVQDEKCQEHSENAQFLRSQLKDALHREEFEIYYQPYFDLKKSCMGMEALIRWNHPNSGLLTPNKFLQVAEDTGFILEMEKWVLTKAIHDIKEFHKVGLNDVILSVNISAKQFENPEFPCQVSQLLEELDFEPKFLTFEITERFLVKRNSVEIMNRLKDFGVRISIDDFGTSYSSLQYLKDLPVDELKIDRSFITDIEKNTKKQKIVEMIVELGHQLQLQIVAEGVETQEQYDLLKKMKCDRIQGFLFSKPEPLEFFDQGYFEKLGGAS